MSTTDLGEPRVRLIASDLDGTLLRDDLSVSARTREAVIAAETAGLIVVPVTARQPHGLEPVVTALGLTSWALCGNGSLCLDLSTGQRLFETMLDAAAQQDVARAVLRELPDTLFASVRHGGETFVPQQGYAALAHYEDHKRDPATMEGFPLADVLAEAGTKLIVRHPTLPPDQLLTVVRSCCSPGVTATTSGAPFVEVMAAGVSKASGLARLCDHLGLRAADVVAFGDNRNDVEMLAWAGHGVAVANAREETLAVADEVTATNEDDGVAKVIERIVAEMS